MVQANLEQLVQRLEAAVVRAESMAGGAGGAGAASATSAAKPSGPAGALAGEFLALTTPLLDDLKAKAAAIGNATVT